MSLNPSFPLILLTFPPFPSLPLFCSHFPPFHPSVNLSVFSPYFAHISPLSPHYPYFAHISPFPPLSEPISLFPYFAHISLFSPHYPYFAHISSFPPLSEPLGADGVQRAELPVRQAPRHRVGVGPRQPDGGGPPPHALRHRHLQPPLRQEVRLLRGELGKGIWVMPWRSKSPVT